MPAAKRTVLVVPHTHWDRDWYWPVERFRVKLVELFQVMLRELRRRPDYRFTLDGQIAMLEDYLEACPGDAPVLARLIRAGRVKPGPMYVLSDLYCTGGEALIRNLLLGRAAAERMGGGQTHLHMPDTFGIVPEVPMIAAGFGMETFTFMRGLAGELPGMTSMSRLEQATRPQVPKDARMFLWSAKDGSRVRVMRLRDGYANAAARLGMDPASRGIVWRYDVALGAEALVKAAERQADAQGEPLLLMAGTDHQVPEPAQAEAMRRATRSSGFAFRFADLDEMAAVMLRRDARRWPAYTGEFHGSGSASVLGGTVSSRVYLKQTNAAVERLLVNAAEPADALCLLAGIDDPAHASLALAWRHLLRTHPHDDICGCSVDAVHRDNEYLMRQAADAADAVRRQMMKNLVCRSGGNRAGDERFSFALVNTQPFARRCRAVVTCDFEGRHAWGDFKPPERFAVVDERGREVPFRVLSSGRGTEHPHPVARLDVCPELPPFTLSRFYLEPRRRMPLTPAPRAAIANEHLRVTANANGTFDVVRKADGRRYRGLGFFSGQADVGDCYDFADIPTEPETCWTTRRFRLQPGGGCGGLQALRLTGTLPVPASSTKEGRARDTREIPVEMDLSLAPGARHVDCRVRFTNVAADHRLRFNLALPFVPATSRAGLKFHDVERPAGLPPRGEKPPRIHPEHPADHFVAVEHRGRGLAVFSEFPVNYEVVRRRPARLAVTLLRAVGFLSRGDMATRGGNAGPDTPTPEAQCPGRSFDMRFAVRPFGKADADGLFREAALWRCAPLAGQIEGWFPPRREDRAEERPWITSDADGLLLSALKRGQVGRGVFARFFNPWSRPRTARVRISGARALQPVAMDERRATGPLVRLGRGGTFAVRVGPHALQTYRIMPGHAGD